MGWRGATVRYSLVTLFWQCLFTGSERIDGLSARHDGSFLELYFLASEAVQLSLGEYPGCFFHRKCHMYWFHECLQPITKVRINGFGHPGNALVIELKPVSSQHNAMSQMEAYIPRAHIFRRSTMRKLLYEPEASQRKLASQYWR